MTQALAVSCENGLIDIIGRGAAKKYKLNTNQKM